ncbi:ABC transporter transmembrane domain-containing protein [Sutcliffiella rhizosphaerae]|uniref:Multidrug resistance ABC transporter ATP-binding/permease protein YheI n=1 Tax=Sutcliffiella rhizosphaerae TaxID=2880967 RepID=A0ABN8AG55_9BACI|nr:ABC transporter transmembrane domain-containing protein [Sutcliffiella rhizosphaerae]CAG9621850.1 putative multidrug resistance ABC transporter ATP-binding/permease protein YheI [Sutcliffiella rhizosphaerae]
MSIFKDLWWFFKQERKSYIPGVLLLALVAFLELIPPRIVGMTVDYIVEGNLTEDTILVLMLVLFGTAILVYILRYLWRIMIFGPAVRLARLLRNNLYEHFTNMSQSFYQRRRVGDLMAHSTNDLQAIQQTAGAGVLTLVDSLMTGGFVLIAMAATISWKLTLICLIPLPFMAISTSYYGSLLHKTFHKAQAAFSSLNDKVQESVNGVKVIKTFGQEKEEIKEFEKQAEDVVKKNVTVAKIDSLFDPTIGIIIGLSFFLAIAFGSRYVLIGEMTIGELIAFTTYLGLLIWPMLAFGWLFNIVERGRASYDRVSALLKEEVDIKDTENAVSTIPTGDICYQVDNFTYPNEKEALLKDIHFDIKQGETLGIVGKTGSGKTTILKMLIREFDGIKGNIFIGGKTVKYYQLEALRNAIGYVPQDHFLFSATIADNIAFALPSASFDDIIQAAKLANIHDDIIQFTDGYQTMVGERGVSLSGGQKQRLSIARALLMDPEILILDDSLSAVDAKTEESILHALKENREGKTTLITSHRLSAIQHAQTIIVLEDGEIVQKGNHRELMEKDGWYKEMYHRQQLESLVEHGG